MAATISPDDLYGWLKDDEELALLDVREEGVFGADGHLLFAVCMPLSRLELDICALVPRKSARVVLCDGGEGLTAPAAAKLFRRRRSASLSSIGATRPMSGPKSSRR